MLLYTAWSFAGAKVPVWELINAIWTTMEGPRGSICTNSCAHFVRKPS